MDKQSQIIKNLQAALDELEVLALEGEIIDLEIVEAIMEKLNKIKEQIKK